MERNRFKLRKWLVDSQAAILEYYTKFIDNSLIWEFDRLISETIKEGPGFKSAINNLHHLQLVVPFYISESCVIEVYIKLLL